MKDTGIVRRIDELGRVVIPKEIRKTLRIKEGDPIEIYTDKDELILRKYSPLVTLSSYGENMLKSLNVATDKICVLTDTDSVLFSCGAKLDIVGKAVSSSLLKILDGRKTVTRSKIDGEDIIHIVKGEEIGAENQIICPIIGGGDCYGAIIMADREAGEKFTSGDVKLCNLASTFLGKQFE